MKKRKEERMALGRALLESILPYLVSLILFPQIR